MRRLIASLVGLCAIALLSGCATVVAPVNGMIYGDVQWPGGATSNSGCSKSATGACKTYLGVFSTGDASIQTIAGSAGITKIHHVDCHSKNIWVLYGEFTVTVYGE
jgi:hypothetical protein